MQEQNKKQGEGKPKRRDRVESSNYEQLCSEHNCSKLLQGLMPHWKLFLQLILTPNPF